ncbi:Uma2 family endonuclease [Trichothermofontia sichuanensis B231]|uniref:Uma2 family endonuclease n=1 Tax=Trichothermofontia sichuanensis TaxID=3045816 RepID=UPI002247FB7A|nr:Uma2 family endonuclease [Trichothermofontia sichuanensis]UZQ54196.1 Uma2 family endonuclease [Trichothermofontia sichuanensis B231]
MTLSLAQSAAPVRPRYDATWSDYVTIRDDPEMDWRKLSFHRGWLWVDMGKEGPNHASFSDLITIIFGFWAFLHPEVVLQSYGRCLLEHPDTHACAPDLVLYKGNPIPKWQAGEPRRIDLRHHRVPDLVGEIADTTLSLDLDEHKQLYASLGIAEYWVIDVKGLRVFAFGLTTAGYYEVIADSQVLTGLPIALLEQTLERLTTETNTAAANWFMQQLQQPEN